MSARIRFQGKLTPKVARLMLEARALLAKTPGDAQFMQWAETQTFVHPQTRNKVKFKSLPPPEQQRIRQRYNQKAQEAEQQRKQQKGEEGQERKQRQPESKAQMEARSFDKWLGDQDPETIEDAHSGRREKYEPVYKAWKKDYGRMRNFTQQQREEKREGRFQEWLSEQDSETQEAYEGTDRKKRVEVRQKFTQHDKKQQRKKEEERAKKREEEVERSRIPRDKLFSMPKDKRPRGRILSDNGNTFSGQSEVSKDAEIKDSTVLGTVGDKAKVTKSDVRGTVSGNASVDDVHVMEGATVSGNAQVRGGRVMGRSRVEGDAELENSMVSDRARVGGRAQLRRSEVSDESIVEGGAQLSSAKVRGESRIRGDTQISQATILGGSWDGQKLKGGGGKYHDAYDQDVLDALTSVDGRHGDSPLRAISQYFADGGRTKGWFGLGGDLDRKQLQKKIEKQIYRDHDRRSPELGSGASLLSRYSDEAFDTLLKEGERRGEELKQRQKQGSDERSKHMLYELTKAAFVHAELRPGLMPLIKMAREARVASQEFDLRAHAIRTAYATNDKDLRRVLVGAVTTADKKGRILKQAARGRGRPRFRQRFMQQVENQRFRHPDTGNDVMFLSLPWEEQKRLYNEWQQRMLDWAHRHMPQNLQGKLGPETRINPENFDNLGVGDVIWSSMNPHVHYRVTAVDREGRRAQNPTLALEQFKPDDPNFSAPPRHLSLAMVRNEMLEHHRVPGMGPRADRERALAALPNEPRGGWPKFDDLGLGERREEKLQQAFKDLVDVRNPREITLGRLKDHIENALGEAPPPRKAVKEFMHQLRGWVGQLAEAADRGGEPLRGQAQAYRAMKLKIDQGISRLDGEDRQERQDRKREKQRLTPDLDRMGDGFRGRWDAEARNKMKPVFARAMQQLAGGRELDQDFAKKLVKDLKDAGVSVENLGGPLAVGSLAQMARQLRQRKGVNSSQRENLERAGNAAAREAGRMMRELREQREEKSRKQRERQEGPRRHENRRQLRGGGRKQMDQKAKLPSFFIGKVLPEGASAEAKEIAKRQLKAATYGDLEKLRKAAAHIADNWDSDFARNHALVQHLGYDREGLKKLQRLLKRKLGDVNGRQYHSDVLEMANKYDLESEDADALYDWRVDKPARGRALSDQEKMSRFMAKAKPETRERMQGMSLADFMVMYKSILKEVLDDEEDAQAA